MGIIGMWAGVCSMLTGVIGVSMGVYLGCGETLGSVGVTGFGPYDTTVGADGCSWDFSRAAVSSSRSMLRSWVQKAPLWECVGDD
jgi:hypothetical protein